MQKLLIIILTMFLSLNLFAQEKDSFLDKIQLEVGFIRLINQLNSDHYYSFQYTDSPPTVEYFMNGLDLKFTLSTKIKYLDFIVGSMFLPGVDEGAWGWVPGSTNSYDYKLNGGGVYAGISPKLKGKNIGLTSEFAIGVFSFKEYLAIFNNRDEPYIDAYEKKTSHGLGAMSSIGIYLKFGKLGVNPTINAVFSGSSSASFMFYGFVLPLTLQF